MRRKLNSDTSKLSLNHKHANDRKRKPECSQAGTASRQPGNQIVRTSLLDVTIGLHYSVFFLFTGSQATRLQIAMTTADGSDLIFKLSLLQVYVCYSVLLSFSTSWVRFVRVLRPHFCATVFSSLNVEFIQDVFQTQTWNLYKI